MVLDEQTKVVIGYSKSGGVDDFISLGFTKSSRTYKIQFLGIITAIKF